jgi:hypothetical protein
MPVAIIMEMKYGNATVSVCDDLCYNLSDEEMEKRTLKVREIIGRIAASPGAEERLLANRKRRESEPPKELSYKWLI